jgi:hypothetical protein
MLNKFIRNTIAGLVVAVLAVVGMALTATAAPAPSDFSLQVSPSPLFTTLKPGTQTELELKIRNAGTGTEELRIDPRAFKVDNQTGKVTLDDTKPSEISQWISFSAQKFTIKSGEWFTQKIRIALPKNTGFSYSLALVINRTNNPTSVESGRLLQGSVAVFTLINVDRPGAVRKIEITKFAPSADIYEYLPVTMNMQFKNVGNTIVQPYGNVFIQRGTSDADPIISLPVNDKGGYILPGSERLLTADWVNGFPLYETKVEASGTSKTNEIWDWAKIADFRIGNYTAKLVAVYNDGLRDVPLEKVASFWVLPWKIMLGAVLAAAFVGLGVWTLFRKIWKLLRRGKQKPEKTE